MFVISTDQTHAICITDKSNMIDIRYSYTKPIFDTDLKNINSDIIFEIMDITNGSTILYDRLMFDFTEMAQFLFKEAKKRDLYASFLITNVKNPRPTDNIDIEMSGFDINGDGYELLYANNRTSSRIGTHIGTIKLPDLIQDDKWYTDEYNKEENYIMYIKNIIWLYIRRLMRDKIFNEFKLFIMNGLNFRQDIDLSHVYYSLIDDFFKNEENNFNHDRKFTAIYNGLGYRYLSNLVNIFDEYYTRIEVTHDVITNNHNLIIEI